MRTHVRVTEYDSRPVGCHTDSEGVRRESCQIILNAFRACSQTVEFLDACGEDARTVSALQISYTYCCCCHSDWQRRFHWSGWSCINGSRPCSTGSGAAVTLHCLATACALSSIASFVQDFSVDNSFGSGISAAAPSPWPWLWRGFQNRPWPIIAFPIFFVSRSSRFTFYRHLEK